MIDQIPAGIQREHILQAIRELDSGKSHDFAESTHYDLLYKGRRYPPKAVIGLAALAKTGRQLGPNDFKGGLKSKCFRTLEDAGFQIVLKELDTEKAWLFQGNPKRYAIDAYIANFNYIYWRANRYLDQIAMGQTAFFWRSGHQAGLVAVGQIAELPTLSSSVKHPQMLGDELWSESDDREDDSMVVGIQLTEFRLTDEEGFLPRHVFLDHPLLSATQIIRQPQGTIFSLTYSEATEINRLWNAPEQLDSVKNEGALEGHRKLRQHYSLERSSRIVAEKKQRYKESNHGLLKCEICDFNFQNFYPTELGTDFIEVHHLIPLGKIDTPRKTTMEDLLLVCSNCHRMIHRTHDVDTNLDRLRRHFSRNLEEK